MILRSTDRPGVGRRLAALLTLLVSIPISIGTLSPAASASRVGEITPRIIGGTEAPVDSWPSQVALLNATEPDAYQAQFCGGTLIDESWVLTAAHCVDFLTSPSQIDVAIGINDLNAVSSGDRKAVRSIVIHPDWNSVYDWDFALLELVTPSEQPVAELIAPADAGETAAGKPARIAGWGCTVIGTREDCFLNGFLPELREATVAFISDSTCQSSWPSDFDSEMMICAGIYPGGGIDTCIGDSGGPLTALVDGGRVLAGVTSWGALPCGLPNAPGVYAKVLAGRDWILGTMVGAYPLTASRTGSGQGTITSDPAGIECGSVCEDDFDDGSTVELTATPDPGSTFTGWSGDCSGTRTCEVTMDQGRDVTATFTADPPSPEPPDPDPPAPQPTAPKVTITAKPAKRTAGRTATFRFNSSQSGSTFRCRLNGKTWRRCSSPKTYRNLRRGRKHAFRVRATKDGLTGPIKLYRWYVKR